MTSSHPPQAPNMPDGLMPKGFSIGLSPLRDPQRWLAPDDGLETCLDEKDRLMAAHPERVFQARADSTDAQEEAWTIISDHLCRAFPQAYSRTTDGIGVAGRTVRRTPGDAPLESAARLVSDDLVLMRKCEDGWRLVAASLCFPSFWRLGEKFDRPITTIHTPVPGFGPGTRNATLVERIFDKLQPSSPVQRSNWSVQVDGELHHVEAHSQPIACTSTEELARLFLRCEYQTLTKLPSSGDILFTIRVATDPLAHLADDPDRAFSLASRLSELNVDGLAYKGLTNGIERLIAHLRLLPGKAKANIS